MKRFLSTTVAALGRLRHRPGFVVLLLAAQFGPATLSAEPPQFNRDVRPILSEYCFACHGPDASARKADLRLDTKDGMFQSTTKHEAAVVPGRLDSSPLWQRIQSEDPDDLMPPPKANKPLKPEHKEILKQWILAGAPWQSHWAYVRPERPHPPQRSHPDFPQRNPIDAFVFARLNALGLTPAPAADPPALARRLSLDLRGLPPTPEESAAFVRDTSDEAYLQWVNRWMDTPQWGEHRARYWLDAARYADTHGLHFDNYREMWPYRDWVIRAFNRNKPFDRFTIEQLAGDLLDHPTDDDHVATGFHRCNLTTNEGGTIEEENLVNYANDRVTTTSWVWLGATLNCASCHDHKFDPFTQRDFYAMAAYFRNTRQSGFDRNRRESDVYRLVPQSETDRIRWRALPAELSAAQAALAHQTESSTEAFHQWVEGWKPQSSTPTPRWEADHLIVPLRDGPGATLAATQDGRALPIPAPARLAWKSGVLFGPAPLLTPDAPITLGDAGSLDTTQPFSFGAWVWLPADFKGEGAVLAKMSPAEERYRGWELYLRDDDFGVRFSRRWSAEALQVRSNEKALRRDEKQHLFVTYDGSGRTAGVRLYFNGRELKAQRDNDSLEGSFQTRHPMRLGRRENDSILNGVAIQDVRIVRRQLQSAEVNALAAAPRLQELLASYRAQPTNEAALPALQDYYRVTEHPGWQAAANSVSHLLSEQQTIRARTPVTLVQEEKTNSAPMARILFRGQYDKPRDTVVPATPAALPQPAPNTPTNRLGLAQWLVSRDNPLTSRVTINRFWSEIFGVGLVKSVEDFGLAGESPSHPDLLDWLAVEFVEAGWDVKHLFRLMVTSSTYRQSAQTTPEKLERDPHNRWLSRGPRFRLDAEALRDYALSVSGLLRDRIGGPSVKPYQPDGVWEAVAMPESNTRYYERGTGDQLYRRSLYTFWKRAAPPPTLDLFNAPSREVCTVRRERTNTPLQALATLNDPQFFEAARHLAQRALAQNSQPDQALSELATRILLRPLTPAELAIVAQTLAEMDAYYQQHPAEAAQVLTLGDSPVDASLPPPRLAAFTLVANQLLNLDEVLNK